MLKALLTTIVSNDITKVEIDQAQYSAMCYEDGGTIDDLIVYKLADEKYLFVPNAANIDKDYAWINEHLKGDVTLKNISDEIGSACDPRSKSRKYTTKINGH